MNENALSIIEKVDTEMINNTLGKIQTFQTLINQSLKVDQDYGVIPGTGNKPTLLKPGAEKINMLLGTTPEYEFLSETEDFRSGLFFYKIRCTLIKIYVQDGIVAKVPVSQGVGSCSTHEKKYRYLSVSKTQLSPDVDVALLPWKKDKWGNVKYTIPNPDLADLANTVLKMAKKRAYIDATLQLAALSDIFTQDLEDLRGIIEAPPDQHQPPVSAPATADSGRYPTPPPERPAYSPAPSQATPARPHNPGVTVIKFGKHNGRTVAEIYATDKGYLEWLSQNAKVETVREDARAYIELAKGRDARVGASAPAQEPAQQEMKDVTPSIEDEDIPLPWDIA